MANRTTPAADLLIAGILAQISADMVADAAASRTRKADAAATRAYKAANIHYGIE